MFDVSFWELLIIGVIALVVVGPERLPGVLRTVGLWVGRARAAASSLRDEVEREVNAAGLRDTERSLRRDVEQGLRDATKPVRDAEREVDDVGRKAAGSASSAHPEDADNSGEPGTAGEKPAATRAADDTEAGGEPSPGPARETDRNT